MYSQEFVRDITANKFTEEEQEIIEQTADTICKSQEHWHNLGVKRCDILPQLNFIELSSTSDQSGQPLNLLFGGPFSIIDEFEMNIIVIIGCERGDASERGDAFERLLTDIGAKPKGHKNWIDWSIQNHTPHQIDESDENEMWSRFYRLALPVNPLQGTKSSEDDLNLRTNLRMKKKGKQHEVLGLPTPLVIDGKAGSGKSSVLYARLSWSRLHHHGRYPRAKLLYITYSPYLARQAKETSNAAINAIHAKTMEQYGLRISDEIDNCSFHSFTNFLIGLLPQEQKEKFRKSTYVGRGEFKKWYDIQKGTKYNKFGSDETWFFIRSLFRGAGESFGRHSREKFTIDKHWKTKKQGGKLPRGVMAVYDKYLGGRGIEVIHGLYEDYEKWRSDNGRWDDMELVDLVNQLITEKEITAPQFHDIFCDEAQDFTNSEVELIMKFISTEAMFEGAWPCITFAGDPHQTINPSHFDPEWNTVRAEVWRFMQENINNVYEKYASKYANISREEGNLMALPDNIRSDKKIVNLGNVLLSILIGKTEDKSPNTVLPDELQRGMDRGGRREKSPGLALYSEIDEQSVSFLEDARGNTNIAFIFWADNDEMLYEQLAQDPLFKQLYDDGIPKPNGGDEEKDQLWQEFKVNHRLWTASDIKGLEFPYVILYRFHNSKNFNEARSSEENLLDVTLLLRRLYVAVTRAEKYLFIIEADDQADYWKWLNDPVANEAAHIAASRVHKNDTAKSPIDELRWANFNQHHIFYKVKDMRNLVPEGFKLLGAALEDDSLEQFKRARTNFLVYLDNNPDGELVNRAEIGRFEAEAHIARIHSLSSTDEQRRKHWKEASDAWEKVAERYSDGSNARYAWAATYHRLRKDWDNATRCYEQANQPSARDWAQFCQLCNFTEQSDCDPTYLAKVYEHWFDNQERIAKVPYFREDHLSSDIPLPRDIGLEYQQRLGFLLLKHAEEVGFDESVAEDDMAKRWEFRAMESLRTNSTYSYQLSQQRGWEFDHTRHPGWSWKFTGELDLQLRHAYLIYIIKDDAAWSWDEAYREFNKIRRGHSIRDWPHKQKFVKPFIELAYNALVKKIARNEMGSPGSPNQILDFAKIVEDVNNAGLKNLFRELKIDSNPTEWKLRAVKGFYNGQAANWERNVITCLNEIDGKLRPEFKEMRDHAEAELSVSQGGTWRPLIEYGGPTSQLAQRIEDMSSWQLKNDENSLTDVANSNAWRRTSGDPLLRGVTPSEIIMLADTMIPFDDETGKLRSGVRPGHGPNPDFIKWMWAGLMAIREIEIYHDNVPIFYKSSNWGKAETKRNNLLEKAFKNGDLLNSWLDAILDPYRNGLHYSIERELVFLLASMKGDWTLMQETFHSKEQKMERKTSTRNTLLIHKANAFAAIERKDFASVISHLQDLKHTWLDVFMKTKDLTTDQISDMRHRWLRLEYRAVGLDEYARPEQIIDAYIEKYSAMGLDDESTKAGLLALLNEAQSKKKMEDKADAIEKMVVEFLTKSWSEEEVRVEIAIHILKELGDFEKNMENDVVEFQELPAGTTKILHEMYNEYVGNYRIQKGSTIIENTGFVTAWRGLALLFLNPEDEAPLFDEIDERLDDGVDWAKRLAIIGHRRHINRLEAEIQSHDEWITRKQRKPLAITTRENKKAALRERIEEIEKSIEELG